MKFSLLIIIIFNFLVSVSSVYANNTDKIMSKSEAYLSIGKVWGFLKYYGPKINTGYYDWDSVLVAELSKLKEGTTINKLNERAQHLIKLTGHYKPNLKNVELSRDNTALEWIKKDIFLKDDIKNNLLTLANLEIFNSDSLYYAKEKTNPKIPNFGNEKDYKDDVYPKEEFRALAIIRGWNAVNYFFAYRDLMSKNMENVFKESIEEILTAKDTLSYQLGLRHFAHYLEDSHANLSLSPYIKQLHSKSVGLDLDYVEDHFVVSEIYDVSTDLLTKGDIVLAVNGINIKTLVDSLQNYYSGSRKEVVYRDLPYSILNGKTDSITLAVRNPNNDSLVVKLHRKPMNELNYPLPPDAFEIISENKIHIKSVPYQITFDSLLNFAVNFDTIIFDFRYGLIIDWMACANRFYDSSHEFAKISHTNFEYPGTFSNPVPRLHKKYNPEIETYKGKIYILTNVFTQSQSEYAVQFFRQLPNVTTVGDRTAGTNGNITSISLPGNFTLTFTSVRVFTPDGNTTQKKGLEPDILVKTTIENIRNNVDPVIKKISYLKY